MEPGQHFRARPNFYYFESLPGGRPGWLPLFHRPQRNDDIGRGHAATDNFPYEDYSWLGYDRLVHRWDASPIDGNWVTVIGQVFGQPTRNEILDTSDLWDVVLLDPEDATDEGRKLCQRRIIRGRENLIAYAPDIWLGNTGWHAIPFHYGSGEEDDSRLGPIE
jgi:hypothetical protein